MDLFDHVDTLPQEVQEVLEKHSSMENSYEDCNKLIVELEAVGYTCDYGLDGVPYDLKQINLVD